MLCILCLSCKVCEKVCKEKLLSGPVYHRRPADIQLICFLFKKTKKKKTVTFSPLTSGMNCITVLDNVSLCMYKNCHSRVFLRHRIYFVIFLSK